MNTTTTDHCALFCDSHFLEDGATEGNSKDRKRTVREAIINHWDTSFLGSHKPRILGKGWRSNSISLCTYTFKKKLLNDRSQENFFNLLNKQQKWKFDAFKLTTRCKILAQATDKYWKSFSEEILSPYFAWYSQILPVYPSACSL